MDFHNHHTGNIGHMPCGGGDVLMLLNNVIIKNERISKWISTIITLEIPSTQGQPVFFVKLIICAQLSPSAVLPTVVSFA